MGDGLGHQQSGGPVKYRQELIGQWTYPTISAQGIEAYSPQMQEGEFCGRLDLDGSLRVSWNGQTLQLQMSNLEFYPSEWKHHLRQGDIVSLKLKEGQFCEMHLLVPSQAESVGVVAWQRSKKWHDFSPRVREFFLHQNFLEITTPSLVKCPGTEPYLEAFSVSTRKGSVSQNRYLPTSPELNLKKHLTLGHSNIFEIKTCFRNNELGPHHRLEFQMLEWYRSFQSLNQIRQDVKDLITSLAQTHGQQSPSFVTLTMAQLFRQHLNFHLTPTTSQSDLLALAMSRSLRVDPCMKWDEIFFELYLQDIEPNLGDGAIFIVDYPPTLAAYSRMNESGWADRFEFFWKGLEIANAFHEINNPWLQKSRMDLDNQRKKELGLEPVADDEDFHQSLLHGLPPCSGIAMGLERLFMALTNETDIGKFREFSE